MEAAAVAAGVSKSTWQRWEVGSNAPRDHWPEVERALGKSRLELEFGLSGAGDPPYPAWHEFLDWIDGLDDRLRPEPWVVDNLRRLRVPDGAAISLEGYRAGMFWLMSVHR